jgi:hypothetical protein
VTLARNHKSINICAGCPHEPASDTACICSKVDPMCPPGTIKQTSKRVLNFARFNK